MFQAHEIVWRRFPSGAALALAFALSGCGPATSADRDGGNGDGGSIDAANLTDAAPPCPQTCSADLHAVLDCRGNVVQTCPMDQGCGTNGCVPACTAAEQNSSTIGCDYYAVDPDVISVGQGACFAAFIANTWGSPVTITVERGGQSLDISGFARIPSGNGQALTYAPLPNGELPPGEVAILFLARFGTKLTSCPGGVTPAVTATDAAVHGTGLGDAFNIKTSAPTVAYDIFPFGGGASAATSATLLIPTSAWDINYIAVDAFRKSAVVADGFPTLAIVAKEDNTMVTINPVVEILGGAGGVTGTAANTPKTYPLQKGQILQFSQPKELIGSPILADKPIGVWGGATCLSIDINDVACDSAHQQIPPVKALGSEYVAVRYRNRFPGQEEAPPWRIVGAVDGTQLTYDPVAPAGAPATLEQGQVAEFNAAGPFVVRSQGPEHPFYMSAHMTGCGVVNPSFNDCRGDPEFVNVIPPGQYLAGYTFFTDPTYPETNLVVTRTKKDGVFHDVSLDCAGVLTGWQPVGNGGEYEYTRTDLVTGNFQPQGSCNNGRREMTSTAPFGLTVWGWGSAASLGFSSQAVSYAYPAGASVKPINTVVVPPIE